MFHAAEYYLAASSEISSNLEKNCEQIIAMNSAFRCLSNRPIRESRRPISETLWSLWHRPFSFYKWTLFGRGYMAKCEVRCGGCRFAIKPSVLMWNASLTIL